MTEYDPNLLSDPQWPCGRHKRVLIFASYVVRECFSFSSPVSLGGNLLNVMLVMLMEFCSSILLSSNLKRFQTVVVIVKPISFLLAVKAGSNCC